MRYILGLIYCCISLATFWFKFQNLLSEYSVIPADFLNHLGVIKPIDFAAPLFLAIQIPIAFLIVIYPSFSTGYFKRDKTKWDSLGFIVACIFLVLTIPNRLPQSDCKQ